MKLYTFAVILFATLMCSCSNEPQIEFTDRDAVFDYTEAQAKGRFEYSQSVSYRNTDNSSDEATRLIVIDMANRTCECLDKLDRKFLANPKFPQLLAGANLAVKNGTATDIQKNYRALDALEALCLEMIERGNIKGDYKRKRMYGNGLAILYMETYPSVLDSICPETKTYLEEREERLIESRRQFEELMRKIKDETEKE